MKLSQAEFSRVKRDKLLDYKIYSENYDELQTALEIVAESLSDPDEILANVPPADLMHPTYVRADLMTEFISACYSAGHEISYIRSLYPSMLEYWETYAKYSKAYNESLQPIGTAAHIPLADKHFHSANRMVCWGILLGFQPLLSQIVPIIDYNNSKRDGLLENLLQIYIDRPNPPPNECVRHLPYFKTLKIFAAPPSERSELVAEYLEDWYVASRRETYFDSHKRGNFYSGYWCWEAAALTVALGIDDTSYLDAEFYPRDLVEFARASVLGYAPPGIAAAEDGEVRSKAFDPCPKAGMWQSLDVEPTLKRFEFEQPMPDLNSAYGLTVWRFIEG